MTDRTNFETQRLKIQEQGLNLRKLAAGNKLDPAYKYARAQAEVAFKNTQAQVNQLQNRLAKYSDPLYLPKAVMDPEERKAQQVELKQQLDEAVKLEAQQAQTIKDTAPDELRKIKDGGAKPGASRDNPAPVTSPAEAAKLPKGTWFKTPDGRLIQRT